MIWIGMQISLSEIIRPKIKKFDLQETNAELKLLGEQFEIWTSWQSYNLQMLKENSIKIWKPGKLFEQEVLIFFFSPVFRNNWVLRSLILNSLSYISSDCNHTKANFLCYWTSMLLLFTSYVKANSEANAKWSLPSFMNNTTTIKLSKSALQKNQIIKCILSDYR